MPQNYLGCSDLVCFKIFFLETAVFKKHVAYLVNSGKMKAVLEIM